MEDRIKSVMADILNLDPARIGSDTSMDAVESWDSLAHINLITALEEEFDVTFDVAEIESMLSFKDIQAKVNAKL